MKRLYVAVALLVAVAAICVLSHIYQHRQLDRMLDYIDRIEATARGGDTHHALQLAEEFATTYQRVSNHISCYVPHGELTESRETADLLPSLLRQGNADELWMELARLRSQLRYIQQLDDPSLQNIL